MENVEIIGQAKLQIQQMLWWASCFLHPVIFSLLEAINYAVLIECISWVQIDGYKE
jgi:hypothetical protein